MAAAVGRVLGNYVLRSVIGRGGMSEVFAAEHRSSGEPVAIKVLRPQLAADEQQAARFAQEAARTRAVEHPNVVRVIDFGREADDGTLYLVMERLEGEDLAARLKRAGRLDEAEVRRIGAAIADGLQAVHERGIVHRDLKPANILLLAGGKPKVLDFGIAKALAADGAVTGPGMGTPHYMAPEQVAEGAAAPSVDVWALGVTLFEAVTGRLPFQGFSEGRCPQLVDAPPRPGELVPLSAGLEALILRCLHKNPRQRPATMREVAERLRDTESSLERATAPIAPTPIVPAPLPAPAPRRRWVTGLAAAVVTIAVAALVGWRLQTTAPPAPTTMNAPAPAPAVAAPPPAVVAPPPAVVAPPVEAAAPPPAKPAAAPVIARPRPKRPAPHKLRSRVYGEKLD